MLSQALSPANRGRIACEFTQAIYDVSDVSDSEAGSHREQDVECPLVDGGGDSQDYGSVPHVSSKRLFIAKSYTWMGKKTETNDFDAANYDMDLLTYWSTFFQVEGSFMDQRSLWFMVLRSVMIVILLALITVYTPAITHSRAAATAKLSTFLNIFMGMLLGFFISTTVQRWYSCSGAFLNLLDSVRNLQMQCFALGVSKERVDKLVRYGVLSARLLYKYHYQDPAKQSQDVEETKKYRFQLWEELEAEWPGLVLESEKRILRDCKCPYGLLWTWVASLIGRMAQDGEIPPMASPTYGRILNIVQNACGSIRQVREFVTVQIPFLYTHTLAVLVHANNIFNAINLGVTTGFTLRVSLRSWDLSEGDPKIPDGKLAECMEAMFVGFFMSLMAPMLYHTLLIVGFCFAQPLSNYHTRLPVMRFMRALEKDLHESSVLSENPPWWERPSFKKP